MPYRACRPPSTAWFPSNNGADTAEPDACAVFPTYGATGTCVVPTVVHGEPTSFDLVSNTNSILISNPHSKGVSAGLPGTRINLVRWVHLRHCGKLDPLAPCMTKISHGCASRCSSVTPYMKYYALSCVQSSINRMVP
jgi:hypothetical protein